MTKLSFKKMLMEKTEEKWITISGNHVKIGSEEHKELLSKINDSKGDDEKSGGDTAIKKLKTSFKEKKK